MAVTLKMSTKGFFDKVLAGHGDALATANKLLANGFEFTIELYAVKAKFNGLAWQLTTATSTSNLMKASPYDVTPLGVKAKNELANFIAVLGKVSTVHYEPPPVPYTGGNINFDVPSALATSEVLLAAPGDIKKSPGKTKKSPMGVIPLRDATSVGQKVQGTSPASVYFTVALNDRVKVAMRREGTALSIRVELKNATDEEQDAVKQSGISWKGAYGSTHLEVPNTTMARRTLGSFLYGMGVAFDKQLLAGEELP